MAGSSAKDHVHFALSMEHAVRISNREVMAAGMEPKLNWVTKRSGRTSQDRQAMFLLNMTLLILRSLSLTELALKSLKLPTKLLSIALLKLSVR